MKVNHHLFGVCAVLLSMICSIVHAEISVNVVSPTENQVIDNKLTINVTVTSSYTVSSVKASVSERGVSLTNDKLTSWTGLLSLEGLEEKEYVLDVIATNAANETTSSQVKIRYNKAPAPYTIITPEEYSVVSNTLRVIAKCTAEGGSGCGYATVQIDNNLVYKGGGDIDTVVDLPYHYDYIEKQYTGLAVTSENQYGQKTVVQRKVYQVANPVLVKEASVNGLILDVNALRILYLGNDAGGSVLKIRDRVTAGDIAISGPVSETARGYLTGNGAVYESVTSSTDASVYSWRNNTLYDHGKITAGSLKVAGDYAVWRNEGNLYLLDTKDGEIKLIDDNTTDFTAVGNNGVVYYITGSQVFEYRDGGKKGLNITDASNITPPYTDGKSLIYMNSSGVSVYQDGQVVELGVAVNDGQAVSSVGPGYAISNGWIAYAKNVQGTIQVFVRSPSNEERQATFITGESNFAEAISPNGDLMIYQYRSNRCDGWGYGCSYSKSIFYDTKTPSPILIGGSQTKPFYVNGEWYTSIGNTLYSFNLNASNVRVDLQSAPLRWGRRIKSKPEGINCFVGSYSICAIRCYTGYKIS